MLPYFVLLPAVLLFLKSSYSGKKASGSFSLPFVISTLILILFAGLRSSDVGTDTNNYVGIYREFSYFTGSIFEMNTTIEIGYLFLQKIALLFSTEYWSLLITIACFAVIPYFYLIKKLSKNVLLSVFLYITLAVYLIFFNAGRQGIAVAITSLSIIYLLKRSMIKYFICIAIASLFHNTAIIMIPFYFILTRKVTLKSTLLYVVLGIVSFTFLSSILGIFSSDIEERYAVYEDRGATGGYLLAVFFIMLGAVLFILRKQITTKNLRIYDVYLNYCLFTSIIYIVVIFTGADVNFIRLTNYFALGFIFIWPIIFEDVKLFKLHFIKLIFVLVHLLFYGVYLYEMGDLVPYAHNPQLFQ